MHSFLLPMNRVGEGRVIISYNILGNLNNLKSVYFLCGNNLSSDAGGTSRFLNSSSSLS